MMRSNKFYKTFVKILTFSLTALITPDICIAASGTATVMIKVGDVSVSCNNGALYANLDFKIFDNHSGLNADYHVTQKEMVTLSVFNFDGRMVKKLVNEMQEPGTYRKVWEHSEKCGGILHSGMYLFILEIGSKRVTKIVKLGHK